MSQMQAVQENPMRAVRLEKVVLNIGVGKSGEPLEKASRVLSELTGQKPAQRKARKTIREFAIRSGEPIGVVVTVRKARALDLLKKLLGAVGNRLSASSFDTRGSLSFGIKEHIDIHGVKYIPDIGIFGINVSALFTRVGLRVKNRKRARARLGPKQAVTNTEAIEFMKNKFHIEVY